MTQPTFAKAALTCAGLIMLLTGTFGCWGHPVERSLRGRWLGEGVEQVEDALMARATGWAKGTSFEFSGSTMTVTIPAEEPRSGKYRVERVNRNDVVLAVARQNGTLDRVALRLDDEKSLRWMIGSGRSIVMRRED